MVKYNTLLKFKTVLLTGDHLKGTEKFMSWCSDE